MKSIVENVVREKIELEKYINNKIVLSGRDKGEEVRKKIGISSYDSDKNYYVIIIPNTVRTWNPSHFLGMFSESIKKLGLDNFMKKYEFISDTKDKNLKSTIKKDLKEGIEWALDETDILP